MDIVTSVSFKKPVLGALFATAILVVGIVQANESKENSFRFSKSKDYSASDLALQMLNYSKNEKEQGIGIFLKHPLRQPSEEVYFTAEDVCGGLTSYFKQNHNVNSECRYVLVARGASEFRLFLRGVQRFHFTTNNMQGKPEEAAVLNRKIWLDKN